MTGIETKERAEQDDTRIAELKRILESNWQEEMEGAATYRTLAQRETDPGRRAVLDEMAASETGHARRWAGRLRDLGGSEPTYRRAVSGKADTLANLIGGADACLRRIEIEERQHVREYGRQLKALGDEPSKTILKDLIEDERRHSQQLRALDRGIPEHRSLLNRTRPHDPAQALEDLRAKRGRRAPASWIGDAIYGANDGLGAIFGIVSGVSGATLGNQHYVLLAGLAGMFASALSMGSGAYLAAKSEREIYEAELFRKREDLKTSPDDGIEELSLVYQVKGLPEEEARRVAEQLAKDPEQMLRMLAVEELNLSEEGLSNPIVSALSGALSTAVGAFIPIIPFFFMHGVPAVIFAAIISLLAHFAIGAAKTLITVRTWWSSGLEMTFVGALEGVITYAIGVGLGHVGA